MVADSTMAFRQQLLETIVSDRCINVFWVNITEFYDCKNLLFRPEVEIPLTADSPTEFYRNMTITARQLCS